MSGVFERANQLAVLTVASRLTWTEHKRTTTPRGEPTEDQIGVPLLDSPTIVVAAELPTGGSGQTATVDIWLFYASLPATFDSKWVRAPDSSFTVTSEAPLIVRGQVGGATRVALVVSGTDAADVRAAVGRSILDRATGV